MANIIAELEAEESARLMAGWKQAVRQVLVTRDDHC